MNFADHFDGCSFIYEDDRTAIANEHAMDKKSHPTRERPRDRGTPALDQHENIRAWLSGVVVDDENKPLVTDVLSALGNLPSADPAHPQGGDSPPRNQPQQGQANVKVHTMGPGFFGRAPPFGSSEFLANMVLVAILLLFAPGFTILAAGVFVTSRVAERWVGQDQ
ncbi:uncharacterized protein GLRG_07658 [Colletotrichum graminicola M1.001]|uniref:Uncharacterized protein n=1 Tax=Colletotrichum graminicola (strain M1.001 / M2 / FGSC 10212) TaxID=645133 RepID=E3QP56_COLGM|nr:uncharacterized protein GLRG_07658 [Colletotrichum graminicola M1.001]EFQ32644.1 hypothetical protein GLRG_07658 [Colletotrichum graminicola M1.001]